MDFKFETYEYIRVFKDRITARDKYCAYHTYSIDYLADLEVFGEYLTIPIFGKIEVSFCIDAYNQIKVFPQKRGKFIFFNELSV